MRRRMKWASVGAAAYLHKPLRPASPAVDIGNQLVELQDSCNCSAVGSTLNVVPWFHHACGHRLLAWRPWPMGHTREGLACGTTGIVYTDLDLPEVTHGAHGPPSPPCTDCGQVHRTGT